MLSFILMSCNQIQFQQSNGQSGQANFDTTANTWEKVSKAGYSSISQLVTNSSDGKTAPYEVLYNNDSRRQSNFTVYMKNAELPDVIWITEHLFKKAKKDSEISVNFFDDKTIAQNFVENQFNPAITEKERQELIPAHTYSFQYIPTGKKALYKNVNSAWEEVKVSE